MRSFVGTTGFGIAIVLLGAALFGTLGPVARFAYEAGMEPLAFIAWRAFGGLLGTLVFVAWRIRSGRTRFVPIWSLPARSRRAILAAGLAVFTLSVGMFVAFDRITIALALLGFYTFPVMIAVAAVLTGHERLDQARGFALVVAMVGMAFVVASQLDPEAGVRFDVLGLALALSAAVSQTVFVLVSRAGYASVPTDQAMAAILSITVVLAALVSLATGGPDALLLPLRQSVALLPLLGFAGLFAAAIPSICFLAGIRLIGGMRAGILMLFEPVVGVALAAWLLAEILSPLQVVGGAAVLGAALILQRTSVADRTPPAPEGISLEQAVPEEEEALALRVPGGP